MIRTYILLLGIFLFCQLNTIYGCLPGDGGPPFPVQLCPPDEPYNETFNWREETFTYFRDNGTNTPEEIDLPSPFFAPAEMVNDNIFEFARPDIEKDFLPEDGWVQITEGFGETIPTGRVNPYFVIYNRYSSVLRVFMAIDEAEQNTDALITAEWNGTTKTALFGHYNGEDCLASLEDFDTNTRIRVPNYFSNTLSPPYWLHADMTMNYDPCTCLSDDAQIVIRGSLAGRTTFQFEIDGDILQDVDSQGREGTKSTYGNNFESSLKGFNTAYKDGKAGVKVLKDLFKKDPDASQAVDNYESGGNLLDDLGDVANFMGGAGQILSGAFKFISLFTGAAKSDKPKPLNFKVDLDVTGTGVDSSTYTNIFFGTPGAESGGFRPSYDRVLGTFNLLQTPLVRNEIYLTPDGPPPFPGAPPPFRRTRRVQLVDFVRYVINPRADINISDPRNRFLIAFDYTTIGGESGTTQAFELPNSLDFIAEWTASPGPSFNDFPATVYLKVMTLWHTFPDANGETTEIPYVARYKIDADDKSGVFSGLPPRIEDYVGNSLGDGSNFYRPASQESISRICNSDNYQNRANISRLTDDGTVIERDVPVAADLGVQLFPNPTSGNTILRYGLKTSGKARIEVRDTYGRLLQKVLDTDMHYPGAYEVQINTTDLSPGMYLIYISTEDGVTTEKLIKQ